MYTSYRVHLCTFYRTSWLALQVDTCLARAATALDDVRYDALDKTVTCSCRSGLLRTMWIDSVTPSPGNSIKFVPIRKVNGHTGILLETGRLNCSVRHNGIAQPKC